MNTFAHVMATAHPHRHASSYVRARRLLQGFRGWAYWITRSLDRENIPRGWQRVCGSTFLKGPSRILGAGTVSCLRVYLTQPRVRTTTTTTTTRRSTDSLRLYPPSVRTENAPRREFRYDGSWDVLRGRRHVTKMKHLGRASRGCLCISIILHETRHKRRFRW